jgi:hypothetical protein
VRSQGGSLWISGPSVTKRLVVSGTMCVETLDCTGCKNIYSWPNPCFAQPTYRLPAAARWYGLQCLWPTWFCCGWPICIGPFSRRCGLWWCRFFVMMHLPVMRRRLKILIPSAASAPAAPAKPLPSSACRPWWPSKARHLKSRSKSPPSSLPAQGQLRAACPRSRCKRLSARAKNRCLKRLNRWSAWKRP